MYLEIFRDYNLEASITKLIQDNWVNNPREGIHLSDLLAPRKAYFQKVDPKPPTIEEILYFLSGNAIEKELLEVMKLKHGKTKIKDDIYYSVDTRMPNITEVKSRRWNLPEPGKEEEGFEHYLNQLSGYLSLDNKRNGNLLVVSLAEKVDASHKTKPVLAAYAVKYKKDELESIKENLVCLKDDLESALKGEEDSLKSLPQCPQWMCGKEIKTMVKEPYCITCQKSFSTDYGLSKHKEGKKTSDHEVIFAEYTYEFIASCKWYDKCQEIYGTITRT
jgi:uncharacterized protein YdcH (DUF465 family)